jgi:hypothetical protein
MEAGQGLAISLFALPPGSQARSLDRAGEFASCARSIVIASQRSGLPVTCGPVGLDMTGAARTAPLVGVDVGRAEQLRVAQVEAAQLGQQAASFLLNGFICLGRRCRLEPPGVLLGGEVHDLGEVT